MKSVDDGRTTAKWTNDGAWLYYKLRNDRSKYISRHMFLCVFVACMVNEGLDQRVYSCSLISTGALPLQNTTVFTLSTQTKSTEQSQKLEQTMHTKIRRRVLRRTLRTQHFIQIPYLTCTHVLKCMYVVKTPPCEQSYRRSLMLLQ